MQTTKIILADDHALVRQCIGAILGKTPGIEVVAEAATGMEAIRLACELQPDLILMDLVMPEGGGIEASRCIVSAFPNVKVLILSCHGDARSVREAFGVGAKGYLMKNCDAQELLHAINVVSEDRVYLSPALSESLGIELPTALLKKSPLSRREEEVLTLIASGKTSREVAVLLEISPKTVETHRMHIMKKLNLNSVASLTKYAIRQGLLPLD
ncbi:response regulator [Geomonas ferrireducens]|uniref:response regulator n=1 Tax=Geomonas ferrireducens TaxID=2570227 RepID=UPI0010A7A132|nr:response regulator transcription factor [Geomonas ferrireducens]